MFRKLTATFFLLLSLALIQGARPESMVLCLVSGEEDCCVEVDGEMVCNEGCCAPTEEEDDCCLVLEEDAPSFLLPEKKPNPSPAFLAELPPVDSCLSVPTPDSRILGRALVPDPPPRDGRACLALFERRLI